MKNIVGVPARGENFYFRKQEIDKIMRSIDASCNIQLTAPRRIGKSSVLHHFEDNPLNGYFFIYIDAEEAQSKNEFYKLIHSKLLRNPHLGKLAHFAEQIKGMARKLKSIKISGASFEIHDSGDINFEEEIITIIKGIDTHDIKIVLMIDEFTEVIINMIKKNNGDASEAIQFLQSNRALRNNSDISGKIQFIYTGSISLNTTVSQLEGTQYINDLTSLSVEPLSEVEAIDLIKKILNNYGIKANSDNIAYIMQKIGMLIPFSIQLIIQEIINLGVNEISIQVVDKAFEKILELRNKNYFEHYIARLRRLFKDKELLFAKDILNIIAKRTNVNLRRVNDIAKKIGIDENATKYVVEILEYDGYIAQDSRGFFSFNSNILKYWWLKHENK